MGFFTQVSNRISYGMHALSYDPEAERYAKEKEVTDARADKEAEQAAAKEADAAKQAAKKTEDVKKQALLEKDQKRRETFEPKRLAEQVGWIIFYICIAFAILGAVGYGATLASNSMVYRSAPFRIAAAVYGGIFCFIVIPYMHLYRWWWLGEKPKYHAFLPFVPYEWMHPWTARLLSWMTYKPVDAAVYTSMPASGI